MKVAVIKLGARIAFDSNSTSGGTGEAMSICDMLQRGGANVNIFTKILKKDKLVEPYVWNNIAEESTNDGLKQCEALVVLNGTVNFFGGAEDYEQLLNYKIINEFHGPIFYILCDPELTLRQIWPSVSKKEWGSKWSEDAISIKRNDIIFLMQPHDTEKVLSALNKNEIVPKKAIHFPFEQFPCLNDSLPFNESPSVDLSYGGTMRNGRRVKKMVKFYFGHNSLNVEMFGKIALDDFDSKLTFGLTTPTFSGPVRYDLMLPKMNDTVAHCVIGDPWYEEINDIPQRLYESIQSGAITFVDNDMDKARRVWKNDPLLGDFLYVNDRQELAEKITLVKSDVSLRKQIYKNQLECIAFDPAKYCSSFVDLINSNLK